MEKFLLKSSLVLSSLLFFAACGGGKDKDNSENAAGFDAYSVISGTLASQSPELLTGSGYVRFNAGAPSNLTPQIVSFRADLPGEGSSVTIVGYASPPLTDGLQIQFERSGATTLGRIVLNGTAVTFTQAAMAGFQPNNLDLAVELHNDPSSGVRIYVWNAYQSKPDANNALLDTSRTGTLVGTLPGVGAVGTTMGLILSNANVSRGRLRPAYLP